MLLSTWVRLEIVAMRRLLHSCASAVLIIILAGQASAQAPAEKFAGYWVADVSYAIEQQGIDAGGEVIARTWGRIHPSGKVELQTDAGCQVSGLLQPSGTKLRGTLTVSGCRAQHANRTYNAEVTGRDKAQMELSGSAYSDNGTTRKTRHSVRGTFVHYSP